MQWFELSVPEPTGSPRQGSVGAVLVVELLYTESSPDLTSWSQTPVHVRKLERAALCGEIRFSNIFPTVHFNFRFLIRKRLSVYKMENKLNIWMNE